jgi:hypothetical protein
VPRPLQLRVPSQGWIEQQGWLTAPQAWQVDVAPPPPATALQTNLPAAQVRFAAGPVPQQDSPRPPQLWQVLPPALAEHWRPPAVQTGLMPWPLSQHGSPSAPQAFPPDTQALPEQVPPPRVAGQGLPWPMQFPARLQQPPLEQELSGQQAPGA